ncbi:MAG: DUF4411 family protein [Phycisphaeraceae bacterium]|nr:DUF4411 family protein [Phycisphaeraceae bacterium]
MAYLLDANIFIQAKNLHYGMDFCPAFWDWLVAANRAKSVYSIEKVGDELLAGDDELAEWAKQRADGFFLPPDDATMPALTQVAVWVRRQNYRPAAVNAFLQDADYYLVAFALAHGHTVVTHEIASDGVKRVKIPTVCIGMKVKCFNPYEMLRRERVRFVLAPPP